MKCRKCGVAIGVARSSPSRRWIKLYGESTSSGHSAEPFVFPFTRVVRPTMPG